MSDVTPLQVKGPIFSNDGTYAFDIELRTIDDPENWVFSLSGFHSEIIIGKDITLKKLSQRTNHPFKQKTFSVKSSHIIRHQFY